LIFPPLSFCLLLTAYFLLEVHGSIAFAFLVKDFLNTILKIGFGKVTMLRGFPPCGTSPERPTPPQNLVLDLHEHPVVDGQLRPLTVFATPVCGKGCCVQLPVQLLSGLRKSS